MHIRNYKVHYFHALGADITTLFRPSFVLESKREEGEATVQSR